MENASDKYLNRKMAVCNRCAYALLQKMLELDPLNRPIPPHTPFKLTKEECYRNPRLMQDPLLLYCPARETAIWLDPEDPWDRRLLDALSTNTGNNK